LSISSIDRNAILSAIEEFDRIGRDDFLRKYGFGSSKSWLMYEGRQYDIKAIIGAAHRYVDPATGPLKPKAFSGGQGLIRKLVELGFSVKSADKVPR
jgi:5-methylcytosine-specific restriction protein A